MAALLASTPASYVDPRASILYGGGNSKITDDQIRTYINTPGVSSQDVMAKALANNVSASQISKAMGDNPAYAQPNVDKYLSDQGITKEQNPQQYSIPEAASTPAPVTFKPIVVGTNDTVQGQLDGILKDPNNPLMVQAATSGKSYANSRGMLNSSIGAGAAENAMIGAATPIAQQDASTNFSAKQQNSQGALTADTFNADTQSRTNMFNTGAAKDIYTANMGNQNAIQLANIDTKNKLAIANVQAMANDSGIMGDLGKTYMSLYQQIISDPNMTPEVKTSSVNTLTSQFNGLNSMLPSLSPHIDAAAKSLVFDNKTQNEVIPGAATTQTTSLNPAEHPGVATNVMNYPVEPSVQGKVAQLEKDTGIKVDPAKVVPEALIEDMRYGPATPNFGMTYTGTDGQPHTRNYNKYDWNAIRQKMGTGDDWQAAFDKMFAPVYPPGSTDTLAPFFYVYR